jgi:dephospho-CoA kinase
MDIREKKHLADYVINNNGTKRQAMAQVRNVFKALMEEQQK